MEQTTTYMFNDQPDLEDIQQNVIHPPQQTGKHLQTVTTYSPEWWKLRKNYIGASEVAAICGLDESSGKTARTVADKKIHDPDATHRSSQVNTPSWWGLATEHLIITAAIHETGHTNLIDTVQRNISWVDTLGGLMASPDAVLDTQERGLMIEAKEVGEKNSRLWRNGPPLGFVLQAHAQMTVMGPHYMCVYLAARLKGAPVQVWTVKRNDTICETISEIVKTFWTQYTIMGQEAWEQYVSERLVEAGFLHVAEKVSGTYNSKIHTLTGAGEEETVQEWKQARDAFRKAEANKKRYDGLITELMDDADTIADTDGTPLVRRSWINRVTLDTRKLLEENPQLEEQYSYPLSYARISTVRGNK